MSTEEKPDELLTINECRDVLFRKVSANTLYLAVENEELPHYRMSGSKTKGSRGKILIRRCELLAWVESQRVGAGGAAPPATVKLRHIDV